MRSSMPALTIPIPLACAANRVCSAASISAVALCPSSPSTASPTLTVSGAPRQDSSAGTATAIREPSA
jgi:hypothetical protein